MPRLPAFPPHACSCCPLSRRGFLAASTLLAAGTLAASTSLAGAAADLSEYIDLAEFRPRPKVRVRHAVLRQKPPYWLGWPGTAYDVEGRRQEYAAAFAGAAQRVGVELAEEPDPLEDDGAVNTYRASIEADKPDALLLSLQHFAAWPWADTLTQTGVPAIIFSPVGMAFTGHVREISRRPGVHVISSLDTRAVEQALRMIRARHQLAATRLLVLAGEERNETVLERLGTKVRTIPRRCLHELFDQMPLTDEARQLARVMRERAARIVEPDEQDLLNAARSFITAKHLLRSESAHAITSDCLGMVSSRVVPTPPCMAASLFQDHGITYGCEADLFAAVSLLLVSYLFDKPGFMNDPVPETVENVLIAAHCTCGTRLNGFDQPPEPFALRSHSESDLGVAMQVLWREGQRVTLVKLQNPNELILDTGTIAGNVDTPPAGGCRTSFKIAMDRVEDVRDVLGFHQVVFYGDHRRDVDAYCQMNGIRVVNSPEHAPIRGMT